MKVKVKKKKVSHSLASLCETLIQENKDLRVQVAHLQDELEIYKNKSEQALMLFHENNRLMRRLAELEKNDNG